jgi:hypothetical protein
VAGHFCFALVSGEKLVVSDADTQTRRVEHQALKAGGEAHGGRAAQAALGAERGERDLEPASGASRPRPRRRRATNFAKFVQLVQASRARPSPDPSTPPSGRESQDVLDWLRRLTLFGIGFKLVRTPTPLPARADAGRPATGGTSGAQSANFRMALGAGVLEPRPMGTAHPKLTN